jgi:gamma-glutamylputrescine oxidase
MGRYGADLGRRLFTLAVSARDVVMELIAEHGIACDLAATGHLHVTDRAADLAGLEREVELAAELGYPHLLRLDRSALAEELASDAYVGGLLDRQGGHFHPLNYALGLAAAAERAGAVLHEDSPVVEIGTGVTARTATGGVTARHGILACDALLGRLDRRLAGRIMPIASHIVATAPLPAPVIRRDRAVSDSRFSVNYFRHTADGRLLFGGGERIRPGQAADIDALVRRPLERIFPQLRGVAFAHRWGGLVSITRTRLPDLGRRGDWLHAQGYSGQGAILSSLAGRLLAAAAAGGSEEFEQFRRLQPPAFPGGDLLRTPLHVLGMLAFGLLDRLRYTKSG